MHSVRKHVMLLLPVLMLVGLEARAEYRCDSPSTSIDARACEKAAEGPAALRQFIQRMRVIESLDFNDYVDEARLIAWANADLGRQASTWEGHGDAFEEYPTGPDA